MTLKSRWLALIQKRLNPRTLEMARKGRLDFSVMHHVGRTSGKVYETPIILAKVPGGFVCELTYGDRVNWYQNLVAAGGASVERGGVTSRVGAPQPLSEAEGLKSFGPPRSIILRLLRRHEFRFLPEDA